MIEQIKRNIQDLKYNPKKISWNNYNEIDNFIKQQDSKLQNGIPTLHFPRFSQSQAFKEKLFFRITSRFPGFDKNNFNDFTFPQVFSETANKRCHYKGYPVFYCGEHPLFSLIEYAQGEVIKNKELYPGIWRIRIPEQTCNVLPIMAANMPPGNSMFSVYSLYEKEIKAAFAAKDISIPTLDYLNLLATEFTKSKEHSFSQLVSHQFLHESKNDCIIYPSSQGFNEFNNYAFSPNYFEKFELLILLKIDVEFFDASPNSNQIVFKSNLLEKAIIGNNIIKSWQKELAKCEHNQYNTLIWKPVSEYWT